MPPFGHQSIHLSKVGFRYRSQRGDVQAIDDVSFDIPAGEFTFLLGPSGCGKSTLLRLIAGLEKPTHGGLEFSGTKPRIRLVFQDHSLMPWLTVSENAALGLEMDGMPARERKDKALAMLDVLGIAGFADHLPHELSGGMKQRVAIARAFVTDPDILLLDEPLRTLDAPLRLQIQEQLEQLWLLKRPTIVFVTHDIDEAVLLGDRVVVMGGHPGGIREIFPIPFERPRQFTGRPAAAGEEVRWQIWELLKNDLVRPMA